MNSSYSTKNLPAGTRVIKISQGHYVIEVNGQMRDESFVTKGDAVRFALYKMSR